MRILWLRILTLILALSGAAAVHAQDAVRTASATSPDGQIAVTLTLDGEGFANYAITRNGAPVIANSRLSILFSDQDPLGRGLTISDVRTAATATTWEQPWGERLVVNDTHNELAVDLISKGGANPMVDEPVERKVTVRFRVFNDGVGFRYEFAARPDGSDWRIMEERTEFNIGQDGTAHWIQAGDWNRYEQLYKRTPIDAVSQAHTPMTMVLADGTHVSIHEAALVDYSGMWVTRMEGRRFVSTLSPSPDGPKVVRSGAFHTPWRAIRITGSASALYDNDLELNLNEPNKLGDVSWVHPQKYLGVWWEMHLDTKSWASGEKHGATNANVMRHIDYAAEYGFRGVLVEGWNVGWDGNWFANGRGFSFTQPYPDFDMKMLSEYGAKKGVKIIGHHETGGNIAVYEDQLDDAMAYYQANGIEAVKTGYVADAGGLIDVGPDGKQRMVWHDSQRNAQHHLKVVQTAAAHKIGVNAHEPIKDTGLRRTYPNWVSREGARGMEYQAWGVPGNPASHVPTLYFTRMLSGPMDYTPGVLSLKGRGGRDLESTLARQWSLYMTLYSPIQMIADDPENLKQYPREMEFLRVVPADWAETHTLLGEVGDFVVVARKDRKSEDWYIGGTTNADARDVAVPLSFLGAKGSGAQYKAQIYRDGPSASGYGPDRHDIVIEEKTVTAADTLNLRRAPAGGFAVRLTPIK